MKKVYLSLISLLAVSSFADPVVSNIRASQRENTKLVDILYDITYLGGSNVSVTCEVSTNSGVSYDVPADHFSGDGYGVMVTTGVDRVITWNAGVDWDENYSEQMKVRITAEAPRFTDNGDGTITDNETGLMWQKSPAIYNGNAGITYGYVGRICEELSDGWRLPSLTELRTLLDTSRTPALPAGHPFIDVRSDILYWTGSHLGYDAVQALSFLEGFIDTTRINYDANGLLPVRSIY